MPKVGFDYEGSMGQRIINAAGVVGLSVVSSVLEPVLARHLQGLPIDEEDKNPIFTQERVGAFMAPFVMHKYRTRDSRSVAGVRDDDAWVRRQAETFISPFTEVLSGVGLDEAGQKTDIQNGHMNFVSCWRPYMAVDLKAIYEAAENPALVDRHKEEVARRFRPGCIDTFSIENHSTPGLIVDKADELLDTNIEDAHKLSFAHDLATIAKFVGTATTGRLF